VSAVAEGGDLHGDGAAVTLATILERSCRGRRVLVTGHTGFVGSWLCCVLLRAGAEITGLALDPGPGSLFEALHLGELLDDVRGDVRDTSLVAEVVARTKPDLLVHLAAQALVLPSFDDPLTTITTNVLGTANVLEALRVSGNGARACLVVTSDKCYALRDAPHVEADPLGGEDPYSASKACAELVAHAYARSCWPSGPLGLATARAGNIIGGGDLAADRIVADCARAAFCGEPIRLRHPHAVRPWQHVLDALAGYLRLADGLLHDPTAYSGPWNFGPDPDGCAKVGEVAELFAASWSTQSGAPLPAGSVVPPPPARPERSYLTLSSAKASERLGWATVLDLRSAIDWSVEIYRAMHRASATLETARARVADQIERYLAIEASLQRPRLERRAVASSTSRGGLLP